MWTVFETERRKGERLTVTAIHVVESNEKADADQGVRFHETALSRDLNNLCCLLDFCFCAFNVLRCKPTVNPPKIEDQ